MFQHRQTNMWINVHSRIHAIDAESKLEKICITFVLKFNNDRIYRITEEIKYAGS